MNDVHELQRDGLYEWIKDKYPNVPWDNELLKAVFNCGYDLGTASAYTECADNIADLVKFIDILNK